MSYTNAECKDKLTSYAVKCFVLYLKISRDNIPNPAFRAGVRVQKGRERDEWEKGKGGKKWHGSGETGGKVILRGNRSPYIKILDLPLRTTTIFCTQQQRVD
jgi:hypothetical protein